MEITVCVCPWASARPRGLPVLLLPLMLVAAVGWLVVGGWNSFMVQALNLCLNLQKRFVLTFPGDLGLSVRHGVQETLQKRWRELPREAGGAAPEQRCSWTLLGLDRIPHMLPKDV